MLRGRRPIRTVLSMTRTRPVISGFCRQEAVIGRDDALMFSIDDRSYAVLETPIFGNGVFMIVSDEEWEAHRMVMKPTMLR